METLNFKTVKSQLSQDEKFWAQPHANAIADYHKICLGASQISGLTIEIVQHVAECIMAQIKKEIAVGNRVTFGPWFSVFPTIQGSFDTVDEAFDPAKHSVELNIRPLSAFKGVFDNLEVVNSIKPNETTVRRVVDDILKEDGVISKNAEKLYVSGENFLVNPLAGDEGCWLQTTTGEIVATGVVERSTCTTLDIAFPDGLPRAAGKYYLCVASRNGSDDTYALSIGKKLITIKN